MNDNCLHCPDHDNLNNDVISSKAYNKVLLLLVLLIMGSIGGAAYWSWGMSVSSKEYTDTKVNTLQGDIGKIKETSLTMEINLRNFMVSQGYQYQSPKESKEH